MIIAERQELVELSAGVPPQKFGRLIEAVGYRGGRAAADGVNDWQWSLPLAGQAVAGRDVLPDKLNEAAVRTPAVRGQDRDGPPDIDRLGLSPALAPTHRSYGPEVVLIADDPLVPTQDTTVATSSRNYRTSVNIQVLIDADTRLVVAVGQPTARNHNDYTAWTESKIQGAADHATVLADSGYQGTGLMMPHRRKPGQARLPDWKEDHNTTHPQGPGPHRTHLRRHEVPEDPPRLPLASPTCLTLR